MFDNNGNGCWSVSDVLPISASEERMALQFINGVAQSVLSITYQSVEWGGSVAQEA